MIDVMGYTSRNRIGLLKIELQKNKYYGWVIVILSGLKNMDYIISDPNLIIKDEEKFYAEEVIYLPEIWNCHSDLILKEKKTPPPFIKNNYITFGSFNNPAKINENVIDCWSKF